MSGDDLNILSSYRALVASGDASAIASRLLRDGETCDGNTGFPSPLAGLLPAGNTRLTRQIADHLFPAGVPASAELHPDLTAMLYENLREKILKYVEAQVYRNDGRSKIEEDDDFEALRDWKGLLVRREVQDDVEPGNGLGDDTIMQGAEAGADKNPPVTATPSDQEVEIALRVLHYKRTVKSDERNKRVYDAAYELLRSTAPPQTNGGTPATWKEITARFESAHSDTPPSKSSQKAKRRPQQKACYICRYRIAPPHHPVYPSMCQPCGEFNLSASSLSLPPNLDMSGKTCLVTGARVNLGYHTTLRLLRCGARVIASSRYPFDAQSRYSVESDFGAWGDRLRVVGADFRAAGDAFGLVDVVKRVVSEWGGRLDVLVNNAAQTLTDSVQAEDSAVRLEAKLIGENEGRLGLVEGSYTARIRGGGVKTITGESRSFLLEDAATSPPGKSAEETKAPVDRVVDTETTTLTKHTQSSWVQSLSEIPYEDVISAHSVNTFVPLILIRELLPLMGSTSPTSSPPSTAQQPNSKSRTPSGYIINVSSREGIFERTPSHSQKSGKHVHTNMSKAALNMITETEAEGAWKGRRVAVNTVDPGYMSAAPEYADRDMPIGWEDGAARVLWPVAVGEREGVSVWGRFLKHFGAEAVDVGVGR